MSCVIGMLIGYVVGVFATLFVAYLCDRVFGSGIIIYMEEEDNDRQPSEESA